MRTNPAIDRPSEAGKLRLAVAFVLAMTCFVTLRSLGQERASPPSKSRVLIQNRSFEKKPPGPAEAGKTVVVLPLPPAPPQAPTPQNPPPQTPPPQTAPPQTPEQPTGPPLQLTSSTQQLRVGEEVKFIVKPTVERLDLIQRFPPLEIDFGDGTPARSIEVNTSGLPHRYAERQIYSVRVYLGDTKSRRRQPMPVSNELTVRVDPWSFALSAIQVEVGEPITLKIDNPPDDPNISYRFHFKEDPEMTDWNPAPYDTYRYHTGGKFAPFAEVRSIDGSGQIVASTEPQEIVIRELPKNALLLEVQPQSAAVGNEVSFTATFNSKFGADEKTIGFKFFFGDGFSSEWQRDRTIQRTYSAAGDYQAQVAVGWRNERSTAFTEMMRSDFRPINIAVQRSPGTTEPGPGGARDGSDVPLYLVYIFAGLVLIAVALLVTSYRMRKAYVSVKPEYVAQSDSGSARTTDGRLTLEFELRFAPNVRDAHYQIVPSSTGFIRFERVTND